ncbi:MAG TPA: RHS repeat-associated core domain-containing protein, partial [Methylomirabilota bacterium]|nr:RHS repeat-associated core domain-containing protein [Methylomirabilota bacterium]
DADTRPLEVRATIRHGAGPGVETTAVTRYAYDAADRLQRVVDARASVTAFVSSARGDVLVVRHPDAGETRRLYAADGLKVYERDATGQEWWYAYDALGRIAREVAGPDPAAGARLLYTYDTPLPLGRGQLGEVRDAVRNDVTRYTYDARKRVARVERTVAGAAVSDDRTAYNDLGEVARRDFQDGSALEYDYGVDGRLRAVRFVRADGVRRPLVEQIAYHPSSRIAQAALAGGAVRYAATFDPATQRLASRTYATGAGAVLLGLDQIVYDRVGNVRAHREALPPAAPVTWALEYDSLYRLRHAVGTRAGAPLLDAEYRYDAAGNFTRNDEFVAGADLAYGALQPDAVLGTAANPSLFVWDAAGRAAAAPQHPLLQWSARKQAERVVGPGGQQLDLVHTHDGALLQLDRTVAGAVTTSRFLAADHEQHGGQDHYFAVLEGVQWAAARPDGARQVYARSLANSVVRVVDEAGAAVAGTDEVFAPFGTTLGAPPAAPAPRGFADGVRGPGGLALMGARPYLAGLGRFLAPDPVLLARLNEELLLDPRQLSPYAYALNNPRGFVDPAGTLAFVDDALFWVVGRVTGARTDDFLSGTWQNFVESWSLVGGTFNTFHGAKGPADVALGALKLIHKLSWGLPNEALGILFGYFAVEVLGGQTRLWQHVQIVDAPKSAAFTLGSKVIGTASYAHEQGHYYQNLLLGPLYLPVIALPSMVHFWIWEASGHAWTYQNFYTEAWAEAWK